VGIVVYKYSCIARLDDLPLLLLEVNLTTMKWVKVVIVERLIAEIAHHKKTIPVKQFICCLVLFFCHKDISIPIVHAFYFHIVPVHAF